MPSYLNFDLRAYAWKPGIDYRAQPELYHFGKGEQGVLICEPYKSEIGPYWRFRTVTVAQESSCVIYQLLKRIFRKTIVLELIYSAKIFADGLCPRTALRQLPGW